MTRPLCVHAERSTTAAIMLLAELHKRPLHICHVARREEVCLHRNRLVVQTVGHIYDICSLYDVCVGYEGDKMAASNSVA